MLSNIFNTLTKNVQLIIEDAANAGNTLKSKLNGSTDDLVKGTLSTISGTTGVGLGLTAKVVERAENAATDIGGEVKDSIAKGYSVIAENIKNAMPKQVPAPAPVVVNSVPATVIEH